jgi:hypothetical protein
LIRPRPDARPEEKHPLTVLGGPSGDRQNLGEMRQRNKPLR